MSKEEKKTNALDTKMSFEVQGETVDLTPKMVMNYLTKGNTDISFQEALMFMNLCKYQKLNPFLNEAYVIKFGSSPAQMVVSKEAYMKKAETNVRYDGIEAGIIVIRDKEILQLEGAFKLPTDTLLGGWATVYRTDRKNPFKMTVSMEEYNTGKSVWREKPATMIRKVAIVQAQREAFPVELGGIYTDVEQGVNGDEGNAAPLDGPEVEANNGPEISFEKKAKDLKKENVDKPGDKPGDKVDKSAEDAKVKNVENVKKETKKEEPDF